MNDQLDIDGRELELPEVVDNDQTETAQVGRLFEPEGPQIRGQTATDLPSEPV
jgi:hypothetical protein